MFPKMLLIINCIAEAWPKGGRGCRAGGNKFAKLMRKPIKRHRYAAGSERKEQGKDGKEREQERERKRCCIIIICIILCYQENATLNVYRAVNKSKLENCGELRLH